MNGPGGQLCHHLLPFELSGVGLSPWHTLPPFPGSDQIEITIGCSNWNRDGTIEACIVSMCEQSFPKENYEIIIVDDNSEDNSREIIEKTIARYPENNIRYFASKKSRTNNEHHPHNVSIRLARGDIWLKNSGDNVFSYNFLEAVWRHHQLWDNLFLTTFWGTPKEWTHPPEQWSKMLLRKEFRDEMHLKHVLKHGLTEKAGIEGHVVDTGGSVRTGQIQDIRGFNELITGGEVGDVELMCRFNYKGLVFGFEPEIFSTHYHLTSIDRAYKTDESLKGNAEWKPKDFVKNPDGYGLLSEEEEKAEIRYGE